jgi:hypothetical protein
MFTRTIGIIELLLLCALFTFGSGSRAAWAIAICYCSIMLLTCGYMATRHLQYDGWTGWLLCSSAFYMLPIGAVLYLAVPRANFALFALCACVVTAERFREKRAEQNQLGWIAPPIISAAFAIWLNLALLEQVVNFVMAATALCATAVYYAKVSRPPIRYMGEPEVMVRPQPTARNTARSVGRAA